MRRTLPMTTPPDAASSGPLAALVALAAAGLLLGAGVLAAVAWAFAPPENPQAGAVAESDPLDTPDPTGDAWSTRRITRGRAEGAGRPPVAVTGEPVDVLGPYGGDAADPQLARSRASSRGLDGGVSGFSRTDRLARVVAVAGAAPVGPGARCDVRVLPVLAGGFNCLVRVVCDGVLLYPNPEQTAGYVACEVEGGSPVAALDDAPTPRDGDPWLRLDLRGGFVSVGDDSAERGFLAVDLRVEDARTLRRR
jgi:hypothetical protein